MGKIVYTASNTFRRFHHSKASIKAVIGPVGSGSSSGCLYDAYMAALRQPPDPDGVRRRRLFIGRGSYSQLNTTVRQTIKRWFPEKVLKLRGKAPIEGTLRHKHPDGKTRVEWHIIMHSVESAVEFEEKSRSFEISDFWFNEFKYMPREILTYGPHRFGRYPEIIHDEHGRKIFDGCLDRRILMDSNMPDDDSFWYDYFEIQHKHDPDVELFLQPGALIYDNKGELHENPLAENIANLDGGYKYYWFIAKTAPETIKTDICNMWGTSVSGLPVYSTDYYDDDRHWSPVEIEPDLRHPLIIGVDWGVRFAGWVFCQYINARLVVLDEILTEHMGTEEQMEDHVIPLLNVRYPGFRKIGWADRSGKARDTWKGKPLYLYIRTEYGIKIKLMPENKPKNRIDAVKKVLRKPNGFVMSNGIKWLRRGFKGHYAYKEKRTRGPDKEYKPEPEKNRESHVHDALQYVALGILKPDRETDQNYEDTYSNQDLVVI